MGSKGRDSRVIAKKTKPKKIVQGIVRVTKTKKGKRGK
jgi:hypothetical protein